MKFRSALITVGSGSLAGAVFSHNKGGNYIRARTVPTNPNTSLQAAVRNAVASLSNLWKTLTAGQLAAWADYAAQVAIPDRLGDSRYLTAQQHFIRSNTPRAVFLGMSDLALNGPSVFDVGASPVLSSLVAEVQLDGTLEISCNMNTADAPVAAVPGDFSLVQASAAFDTTINRAPTSYRYVDKEVMDDLGAQPVASTMATTRLYAVVAGKRVFIRVRNSRNDGRLSFPAVYSVITTVATP